MRRLTKVSCLAARRGTLGSRYRNNSSKHHSPNNNNIVANLPKDALLRLLQSCSVTNPSRSFEFHFVDETAAEGNSQQRSQIVQHVKDKVLQRLEKEIGRSPPLPGVDLRDVSMAMANILRLDLDMFPLSPERSPDKVDAGDHRFHVHSFFRAYFHLARANGGGWLGAKTTATSSSSSSNMLLFPRFFGRSHSDVDEGDWVESLMRVFDAFAETFRFRCQEPFLAKLFLSVAQGENGGQVLLHKKWHAADLADLVALVEERVARSEMLGPTDWTHLSSCCLLVQVISLIFFLLSSSPAVVDACVAQSVSKELAVDVEALRQQCFDVSRRLARRIESVTSNGSLDSSRFASTAAWSDLIAAFGGCSLLHRAERNNQALARLQKQSSSSTSFPFSSNFGVHKRKPPPLAAVRNRTTTTGEEIAQHLVPQATALLRPSNSSNSSPMQCAAVSVALFRSMRGLSLPTFQRSLAQNLEQSLDRLSPSALDVDSSSSLCVVLAALLGSLLVDPSPTNVPTDYLLTRALNVWQSVGVVMWCVPLPAMMAQSERIALLAVPVEDTYGAVVSAEEMFHIPATQLLYVMYRRHVDAQRWAAIAPCLLASMADACVQQLPLLTHDTFATDVEANGLRDVVFGCVLFLSLRSLCKDSLFVVPDRSKEEAILRFLEEHFQTVFGDDLRELFGASSSSLRGAYITAHATIFIAAVWFSVLGLVPRVAQILTLESQKKMVRRCVTILNTAGDLLDAVLPPLTLKAVRDSWRSLAERGLL